MFQKRLLKRHSVELQDTSILIICVLKRCGQQTEQRTNLIGPLGKLTKITDD